MQACSIKNAQDTLLFKKIQKFSIIINQVYFRSLFDFHEVKKISRYTMTSIAESNGIQHKKY